MPACLRAAGCMHMHALRVFLYRELRGGEDVPAVGRPARERKPRESFVDLARPFGVLDAPHLMYLTAFLR
jgi:hypothetical protein